MTTVEEVQQRLMVDVFSDRKDIKKTAGRALGIVQEIIVFYLLRTRGLGTRLYMESDLPEYGPEAGSKALTHRVEFTIHDVIESSQVAVEPFGPPANPRGYALHDVGGSGVARAVAVPLITHLAAGGIHLPAVSLGLRRDFDFRAAGSIRVAECISDQFCEVRTLRLPPVAFVECKRVGLEEGTRTGPQTIEKAKQAAYIALRTSAVQRVRTPKGLFGAFYLSGTGELQLLPYQDVWRKIVDGSLDIIGAVRSVIFLGDSVNWFPGGYAKKDVDVIVDNYDWTVWVEDKALAEFAEDLIFRDTNVAKAFRQHHDLLRSRGMRFFSKQSMWMPAHEELDAYFGRRYGEIRTSWFRVLGPSGGSLDDLFEELRRLSA